MERQFINLKVMWKMGIGVLSTIQKPASRGTRPVVASPFRADARSSFIQSKVSPINVAKNCLRVQDKAGSLTLKTSNYTYS